MITFVFPGQGSQRPGMGTPWTGHSSWRLVADASDATGRDVEALLLRAEADELTETRNSQLATFVLSMVVLDATRCAGLEASAVAGHSLGEYTALTAAGAMAYEDAVRLVAERGEAMQTAALSREGAMAAVIGLDATEVESACERAGGDVWLANDNAPGQVVIAGAPAGLDEASGAALDLGARKVMALPVGGAFHTPLMEPARPRLEAALAAAGPGTPILPTFANVDAAAHEDGWAELLSAQLTAPVRWRQTVERLAEAGTHTFLELGPGNVLAGTVKRIAGNARRHSVDSPESLEAALQALAVAGRSAS